MPRHTFGDAMPPHLQLAAVRCTLEVVDQLQGILKYSVLGHHDWVRMCMYRTGDAMDTIGYLVGVIGAHLEREGGSSRGIRNLLRADTERLRTIGSRFPGRGFAKYDLERMPDPVCDQVRTSLAYVVVRLPVMLGCAVRSGNVRWPNRCLGLMADAMDELAGLANLLAAVRADELSDELLMRYQQLYQQRPRAGMPYETDRDYLKGLLDLPGEADGATWSYVGRSAARRMREPLRVDPYEAMVMAMLVVLDDELDGRRWEDRSRRPWPLVRNAAVGCLNGLELALLEDGEDPLYWLADHDGVYAENAALAMSSRLASIYPDGSNGGGMEILDVLHATFDRAPVRSER
ncbi:hypothetical protein ADK60_10780 [Streptomyces sp. XY431]|uniref:hypothetical protein n=1 Tax=Streptomyces sp. XY431 TaxID=1415562 RepID=UPI0006B02F46|nr:hypothetical protein [Streptomyces sp. XY431]KOV34921.1 hypothetical protein ADK60_10780 [Streptomyces sp. XY431]